MGDYLALKTISFIYTSFGLLVFIASMFMGFYLFVTPVGFSYDFTTGNVQPGSPAIWAGIVIMVAGSISALSLVAFGQFIQLMLEMLENSREQTLYLKYLVRPRK